MRILPTGSNLMKDLYFEGSLKIAKLITDRAAALKKSGGAVLVFPHKSVDGDCVGSSCAVASIFRNLGANAWVAMPEEIPDNMGFLGVDDLLFYPEENFLEGDLLINGSRYETAFSTDCTEGRRMGTNEKIFEYYPDSLDIDHHEVTHLQNDLKWIEPGASSACEMVYYVACQVASLTGKDIKDIIDLRAAKCLMAGIVTDTGRFTYTNTKPETLEAAGTLMELGGNITEVCYQLFDLKTPQEFSISTAACSVAKFYNDGKLAITKVTESMFKEHGANLEDISDVVSRLRDVGGVEFACVLREAGEGIIRGNLRSKSYFDCSVFAEKYGGGGHKRASGFTISGRQIDELEEQIVREASKLL